MKKELALASMILFLLFAPLTNAAFAAEENIVGKPSFLGNLLIKFLNLLCLSFTLFIY